MSDNLFIVSWDSYGLEAVVPFNNIEQERIMDILAGRPVIDMKLENTIFAMQLRARMNPQRFYEIYAVWAVDGITKEDIEEMFENAPQLAAETMRKIGQKLYGDRAVPERTKIT